MCMPKCLLKLHLENSLLPRWQSICPCGWPFLCLTDNNPKTPIPKLQISWLYHNVHYILPLIRVKVKSESEVAESDTIERLNWTSSQCSKVPSQLCPLEGAQECTLPLADSPRAQVLGRQGRKYLPLSFCFSFNPDPMNSGLAPNEEGLQLDQRGALTAGWWSIRWHNNLEASTII